MEKGNEHSIENNRSRNLNPLDTRYFLPDERSLSDFLKFINRLSKSVVFYDENLNPKGDWYDFFISDELFLLAEIESFDLKSLDKRKTEILLKFEKSANAEEKSLLIKELFEQILFMLQTIDGWYICASKYNKQRNSSSLEKELVSAISYRCREVFIQLSLISEELEKSGGELKLLIDHLSLCKLWEFDQDSTDSYLLNWGGDIAKPDYLLKQLLLLHRPVYKTLLNLMERSRDMFQDNLHHNENHEPHIGLILSFFQLFKKLQYELNEVPDRLLTYYYEQILGQSRRGQIPDSVYCYVELDPEVSELILPEQTRIIAGQNTDGQDILYEIIDAVKVSNVKLSRLYTLFVSRNKLLDPGSSFQMVNGIYASHINPNEKFSPFLALGQEQRFLSEDSKTMEEVDIGFAVSSPTLKMKGGIREVNLAFVFLSESYQYFLTMLLSVAKTKKQLPEEIFHQIFTGSLLIEYTTPKGWCIIDDFEIVPPQDWNERGFQLSFKLGASMPEFAAYQEEIHQYGMGIDQPTLRIKIKNQTVFHPYSFLQFLELEQLKITVDVQQLKNLSLYSNYGPMDQSIPFDLFGPTPKAGSYLLVGNDEIFAKDLDELKIGWSYYGLPGDQDMESYFGGYPYQIKNDSFKVKFQALSDFRFLPIDTSRSKSIDLFAIENGAIQKDRLIQEIDLSDLAILPDYKLSFEDDDDTPLRQKTGFIKMELVSPAIGFGFEVYSDVYSKSVTRATNLQLEKPKTGFSFDVPNEPFSPMATDIYIDYQSSSEINFLGTKSYANQSDKGENLIQIHPFGTKFLLKNGFVFDNRLLPFFELQGAVFMGIEADKFPSEFSVLFQIGKNETWTHGEAPLLDWFYLSADEWRPFKVEDLLFDATFGLTRSGIISFKSPPDITKNNLVMPGGLFWICSRTKSDAEMASVVSGIFLNAFSANAVLQEGKIHNPILPAGSVQSFEYNVPGILDLIQPIPSTGGRSREEKVAFYHRISESLKHKHRAVTKWDIEKILLNEFGWLGYVKVFGNFGNENFLEPGVIRIVGIPKIADTGSFYQPKLNPGQIKEIEFFLKKIVNPFMLFKVINPQYEYLMIKGKLKFNAEDSGLLIKKMYQTLLEEICPWFYEDLSGVFANREAKKSEIFNLILNRPYVKFLTGFSIAHMYKDDKGDFVFVDGALLEDGMDTLEVGKPWSILVPYPLKNLELVKEEAYSPATPFDQEDLILGENLIITSDDTEKYIEPPLFEDNTGISDEATYHFTFRI